MTLRVKTESRPTNILLYDEVHIWITQCKLYGWWRPWKRLKKIPFFFFGFGSHDWEFDIKLQHNRRGELFLSPFIFPHIPAKIPLSAFCNGRLPHADQTVPAEQSWSIYDILLIKHSKKRLSYKQTQCCRADSSASFPIRTSLKRGTKSVTVLISCKRNTHALELCM